MNSFENVITLIIISAFFILSIYGIGYGSAEARYRKKVDSAVNEKLKKEKSDLALERGRLQVQSQNLQSKTVSLESRMQILDKKEKDISVQVQQVSEDLRIIEKKEKCIKKIQSNDSQSCPWLAQLYADLEYIYDKKTAIALLEKSHPAPKASQDVSRIAAEKRKLRKENKLLVSQLKYYEALFPWLNEFEEVSGFDARQYAALSDVDESDEYSSLKKWLSPEEYQQLPSCEKYQLALNRYCARPKSKWEVGIEYERYVGYQYELQGYRVKYNGAITGLNDMGRDLIATKGTDILVIQCKRWAKEKIIRENHIFQLYGTMILKAIETPEHHISGLFVTTTNLSTTAKQCAAMLGISVIENYPCLDYPLIKCNISKDGEKIYHLPFDQQYDNTMINPADGDCYTNTVTEAEELGFRRAYRWSGNK